jgi:hemerythrin superfamily protein
MTGERPEANGRRRAARLWWLSWQVRAESCGRRQRAVANGDALHTEAELGTRSGDAYRPSLARCQSPAVGEHLSEPSVMEVTMPDVIKLLEGDHREVEKLFAKAEANTGAAKAQVVAKIARELTVHAEVEETIVYPSMRQAGLGDLVEEAEQEHQKVKDLVAQLEAADGASSEVDGILADLKANVSHHVGEEESEAFPKFRQAVDQSSRDALGQQVEDAKASASG